MNLPIKIILSQVFILVISLGSLFSQTTIAKQSFETSGDTWIPMTLSQPSCDGIDTWGYRSTSLGGITAVDGLQFWGIHDLNGTCNGSQNQFETISLPNVNVSLYSSVSFSFQYNVIGYDNGDDMKYELFYDGVSQGVVFNVTGASNFTTGGWLTESVVIPGSVTNVSVILSVKQNGNGDYGGLDNVILQGTSTCTPSTISSVSPTSGAVGTTVTITASSGDLTGGSVSFNGIAATVSSSNATTIVCTVPVGATSGDLTIVDSQPCTTTFSTFTVTCAATTEPTTSANTLNFSNVACDGFTFDWVNGDGANRIVVMSISAIVGLPTDQTNYVANSTFGSGSTIAAGEFVVYNGTGNSITVIGLTINTTYFVNVYEYNGTTINCTENYLTSSILSGSQTTLSSCPVCPHIQSILVNTCGGSSTEGRDEYVVFKNGSSSLPINDIQIDFPFAGSYCNTACGTKTLVNNATYIASLNSTASCSKFVYIDPIPANATVIIFTAQSPLFNYDFSALCSNGEQIAALFCNSTSSTGRYANNANANRSTTLTWGTCSQTATFFSSTANTGTDGDFADFDAAGVVSYSNNGACLATPLPAEINYFNAYKSNNGVQLTWETWSEVEADHFELLKSSDGINYQVFDRVKANGTSNEIIKYSAEDNNPIDGVSYYQLDLINYNGRETLGNAVINYNNVEVSIVGFENYWEVKHNETAEGVINIYSLNGVLLSSVPITNYTTQLSNIDLPKGVYIVELKSDNVVWTTKVVK